MFYTLPRICRVHSAHSHVILTKLYAKVVHVHALYSKFYEETVRGGKSYFKK
jgi:hypothetical protein